jgi:hypothetical protein
LGGLAESGGNGWALQSRLRPPSVALSALARKSLLQRDAKFVADLASIAPCPSVA